MDEAHVRGTPSSAAHIVDSLILTYSPGADHMEFYAVTA
jgi:hypothetical protein